MNRNPYKNGTHGNRLSYAGRKEKAETRCERPLTSKHLAKKRERHASASQHSANSNLPSRLQDGNGGYALDPLGPTHHPPGSEGKKEVLASRALRRVALFHPLDSLSHVAPLRC